jgi:hypothetical protein
MVTFIVITLSYTQTKCGTSVELLTVTRVCSSGLEGNLCRNRGSPLWSGVFNFSLNTNNIWTVFGVYTVFYLPLSTFSLTSFWELKTYWYVRDMYQFLQRLCVSSMGRYGGLAVFGTSPKSPGSFGTMGAAGNRCNCDQSWPCKRAPLWHVHLYRPHVL